MEWLAFFGVILVWWWAASRLRRTAEKIAVLEALRDNQERTVAELTRRVFALESSGRVAARPPNETPVEVSTPEPEPEPLEPALTVNAPEPQPAVESVLQPEPGFVPPSPQRPSWREQFQGKDWESMIGTSWLNALGVLIVVVGVSLFLGYALTQFGPLGKISIGAAASLAMLGAGAWVERKEIYARLGRGLMAAGWGSLYFTAFASYALPAARVVDSPVTGLLFMLIVACCMIAHSLRYQSQTATMVAYAGAYLALQLTPASAVSLGASLPMAISLLTLSRRFGWETAPLVAMLLTYLTFACRFGSAGISSALGAGTLYAYWLSFEMYDLLKLRAAAERSLRALTVFPLNALLLVGTALLTLPPSSAIQGSNFLATAGAVFVISTILRRRWEPAVLPEERSIESILMQGHRIAISFAAMLVAGAIQKRFPPARSVIGLMLEGQLLVLAGLRLNDWFFRLLGGLVLGSAPVVMAVREVAEWRWLSLGLSGQYYVNRWLARPAPFGGAVYTWAALGLLVCATGDWVRLPWIGALWIALGVLLYELHRRLRFNEFLYQSIVAGVLGFGTCWFSTLGATADEAMRYAASAGCGAALYYYACWRAQGRLRDGASLGGTLLAAVALWQALPAALVAPVWGLLTLVLLEVGEAWKWVWLRRQSYALALLAMGWLFAANFPVLSTSGGISHRLLTVLPMILLTWHCWRRTANFEHPYDVFAHRTFSWVGVIVAGALVRFELGRTLAVLGWAMMMLTLLHYALRRDDRDQLLEAYALAILVFFRAWATNFSSTETVLALPARIATGIVVIAAFYAGEFRLPREWKRSRMAFAVAGSALLGILLYYEVSGRILTIAWGAEAVALLAAGFGKREQVLRLTGLALFALCIGKLFFYDLRTLDTLSRIIAFIVMGLVLLGASSLYMRFEKRMGNTTEPPGESA